MAERVALVGSSGGVAIPKVRNPWAVALLHLVPFYGLYWYYVLNAELRDAGRAVGNEELAKSRPILSLLALFPGGLLIVPSLISFYRAAGRIRTLQEAEQVDRQVTPWLIVLNLTVGIFLLIPALYAAGSMQSHANSIWRLYGDVWVMATGEAARHVGRTGQVEVPLCAGCVSLVTGDPTLEADLEPRWDDAAAACDLCGRSLPVAAASSRGALLLGE